MPCPDTRLAQQLAFLMEVDRLKTVLRASRIADESRVENSAEHSWHLALFATILADQAPEGVDITRVVRMLLIHDIVEIDTGDVPIHAGDGSGHDSAAQQAAEAKAALRIFGLLPEDQAAEFHALWREFEEARTPAAIFAKSLDRVQPVMLNLVTDGGTWKDYNVTREQLETRVGVKIARGAPRIWAHIRDRIDSWFAARPQP